MNWRFWLLVGPLVLTVGLLAAQGPAQAGHKSKVMICHVSGGGGDDDDDDDDDNVRRGQVRLISVRASAVARHLRHGDFLPLAFFSDNDGDGFGDGETSVTACAAPSGFVDNSDDNCPVTFNDEQFDSDRDGKGNACDVMVTGASLRPQPTLKHTATTAQAVAEQLVAVIENNSDLPQPWQIKVLTGPSPIVGAAPLPAGSLLLKEDSGVLEPGESVEIVATLSPDGLDAGNYYSAFSLSVDGDNPFLELVWRIIDRLFPTPDCLYKVDLETITVTEGEGPFSLDETLELIVEAGANGDWVTWSGDVNKKKRVDVPITTVLVPASTTRSVRVEAVVTEEDKGLFGGLLASDVGQDQNFLGLTCSANGVGQFDSTVLNVELRDTNTRRKDGEVDLDISATPLP